MSIIEVIDNGQVRDGRLLTCPFCGAEAVFFSPRKPFWAVTCTSYKEMFTVGWDKNKIYCQASMGDRAVPYATQEEALEAWNRRI